MPRGTGSGSIFKRGRIWWCRIHVDGRPIDRSSGSESYDAAKRLLVKLNGLKSRGELGGAGAKLTINHILDHYLKDQALHVKPETLKIEKLVVDAHLRPHFGKLKSDKVTSNALTSYRNLRTMEGAHPTTCNRELSYLRTAMRTASRTTPPMIVPSDIPIRFPIVAEDAFARQGFIEDADFEKVVIELPSYLVPLTVTAYNTGIRRGELLRIKWDQIDFDGGVIRLHRGRTKTGDPRTVPMIGKMKEVLLKAKADRDEYWPECDHVFYRLGQPIKVFKNAWEGACQRAGMPDLQFHDLRRSGARNLSRAGVSETVIMRVTGHKTRAMFDRYNVVSETDLTDAAAKLDQHRRSKQKLESDLNRDNIRDSVQIGGPEMMGE